MRPSGLSTDPTQVLLDMPWLQVYFPEPGSRDVWVSVTSGPILTAWLGTRASACKVKGMNLEQELLTQPWKASRQR